MDSLARNQRAYRLANYHAGSISTRVGRLAGFVEELRRAQIDLRYLDVGGGLGVRYSDQKPPTRMEYARLVSRMVRNLECTSCSSRGARSLPPPACS